MADPQRGSRCGLYRPNGTSRLLVDRASAVVRVRGRRGRAGLAQRGTRWSSATSKATDQVVRDATATTDHGYRVLLSELGGDLAYSETGGGLDNWDVWDSSGTTATARRGAGCRPTACWPCSARRLTAGTRSARRWWGTGSGGKDSLPGPAGATNALRRRHARLRPAQPRRPGGGAAGRALAGLCVGHADGGRRRHGEVLIAAAGRHLVAVTVRRVDRSRHLPGQGPDRGWGRGPARGSR